MLCIYVRALNAFLHILITNINHQNSVLVDLRKDNEEYNY